MLIIITTSSIFAITGLVWMLNKILSLRICAICAGVSGTWMWMLVAKFLGYEIELIIPALLIGGSVVGIAYQLEKRLPDTRSPLLWKTLFIPIGFVAGYGLISSWWSPFVAATIILIILTLNFFRKSRPPKTQSDKTVEVLKNKMKNCC